MCVYQKYPPYFLDKLVLSEYIYIVRKSSYESKIIEYHNQGEGQCLHRTGQDEDNL